jgi:TniQ/Bacterial regulatory helix-turn-helix protein, lysR family
MTPDRLPFTLAPLPGESFESWLEAYAARLQVSTTELATALGLPEGYLRTSVRLLLTHVPAEHLTALSGSTGLSPSALAGMFHRPGPQPTPDRPGATSIHRAWSPMLGTRFCPTCLAGNDGRFQLAWRLPWTFLCLDHNQPLASACPRCTRPPRIRIRTNPRQADRSRCSGPASPRRTRLTPCDADLTTATPPSFDNLPAARHAQLFINRLLTHAGDPDTSRAQRQEATDTLTDLTVIAFHLAGPSSYSYTPRRVQPNMLRTDTLTGAVDLLGTGEHNPHTDPLAALVHQHAASPTARAVPESWRPASPTLAARITHRRDAAMTAIERLRYTSTLPTPTPPRSDPGSRLDPANTRAARLPDQIWSVWAVRLLADDTLDPTLFRQAAAVALLLPHSNLTLAAATALLTNQVTRHNVQHQMKMLAKTPGGTTALRIITELSLAVDDHHIPIDYARRRHLATTAELIDAATWRRLARRSYHFKGGHRRLGFARRYLYELLTAGSLAIAPHPYTLPQGLLRFEYHDFVLGLPDGLVTTLADHASDLLTQAGITDEPLQWHPPTDWVTVRDWPGADPDQTDPAPIHQALLNGTPPSHAGKSLALSTEHLRYVIRRHPLPGRPHRAPKRGSILPWDTTNGAPPQTPGAHYVDPAWLHEQYVTWQRTLRGIAYEVGCTTASLMLFAKQHAIPLRPRSGGNAFISHGATPHHPADLPDLLRTALTGQGARQRVERFLLITEHRSLRQAADHIGATSPALSGQLTALERQCGGQLIRRGAPRLGDLTPLGQQLRQQARQYLVPTPTPAPT